MLTNDYYNINVQNSDDEFDMNEDDYLYLFFRNKNNKSEKIEIFNNTSTSTKESEVIRNTSKSNENSENKTIELYESKKIFRITKVQKRKKKKLGRIPKKEKEYFYGAHNKSSQDNIELKVIRRFTKSTRDFINTKYKYLNKKRLLEPISPKILINAKKSRYKDFYKKLKDFYSSPISPKCITLDENYNERQIKQLYTQSKENNDKRIEEIIKILDTDVNDIYNNIYLKDNESGIYKGYRTFKYDLERQEGVGEKIEGFLKKYKTYAENLLLDKNINKQIDDIYSKE